MLCLVTHRRMTWFIEVFLHVQCLLKQLLALLSLSEAAHDCTQVCESYCNRRMIVLVAFIVDTQRSLKTVPEKLKKACSLIYKFYHGSWKMQWISILQTPLGPHEVS